MLVIFGTQGFVRKQFRSATPAIFWLSACTAPLPPCFHQPSPKKPTTPSGTSSYLSTILVLTPEKAEVLKAIIPAMASRVLAPSLRAFRQPSIAYQIRQSRSFQISTRLRDAAATAAPAPVRKPVGAFRGGYVSTFEGFGYPNRSESKTILGCSVSFWAR